MSAADLAHAYPMTTASALDTPIPPAMFQYAVIIMLLIRGFAVAMELALLPIHVTALHLTEDTTAKIVRAKKIYLILLFKLLKKKKIFFFSRLLWNERSLLGLFFCGAVR